MSIKTEISEAQALARSNAVVGGTKNNSIQTTGGTIVGESVKMDSYQNHNLPTLWSLKAARGQRYRHFRTDGNDHIEYPGLYVYLGYNYATALESVQIKNTWITDGTHPSWLVYADFLDHTGEGNDRVYTYKVNAQGEVDFSTPVEIGTGRTKQTVLDAFMVADYKTVDGWYELPCPATYAAPLYAVCFSGPSFVPCLAFISVNSPTQKGPIESPEGMDAVASYKFHPDFSKFHQWAQNWDDSYHGLIGSPKMVVDENPYCTNPDAWTDEEHWDDWRWGIFATGTTMEFTDTVDTYNFGFRPMLSGPAYRADEMEQWNYSFVLEFQPPTNWMVTSAVGVDPPSDTVYKNGNNSMKPYFIKTVSADEGTVYKLRIIHNNGYENTFYMIDPTDEIYEAIGLDRTANIVFREDKCDLVTQKGEEIALIVKPDYEGGYLDNISVQQSLKLVLCPLMLDNTQTNIDAGVGGILAYYPRIVQGVTISTADVVGKTRLPWQTLVTVCEILGGVYDYNNTVAYYRQSGQNQNGPFPCGCGENEWRVFGNLCPKYKSISLEGTTNNTPGDSLVDIQPDQYTTTDAKKQQGRYFGQNGSIDHWSYSDVTGGAIKSYYSLYEFADAPYTDVTEYYQHAPSGGGDPTPLEPGESIDGKDVEPKTDFGLIARVKNTKDEGEAPSPTGTTQDAGYHLEYIDFQSIRKGHWITGGDDTTNYGKSLAIDDGTSRITITIVS